MLRKREQLEYSCRMLLRQAAEYSDSGRESIYQAYRYAYARLDGMARALSDIYEFELAAMVRNYQEAANTKIYQDLGITL